MRMIDISGLDLEGASEVKAALEGAVDAFGAALREFPRLPSGLTPDEVRATQEWRHAKAKYDGAFADLREFNAWYVKRFKAELRTARERKRVGAV